jgi:ElaB/YqjD/DUF883 family membrane-anchored ribosome-binding protein
MITHKNEPIGERITDAADAVKQAWSDAKERGGDVLEAARDKVDGARHKVGDAQDALADQLESAAAAIRHRNHNAVSRMAHDRPMSTVVVAFAVGAVVGALAGMVVSSRNEA